MAINGSRLVFMIPGRFLRFQVGFSWFQVSFHGSRWIIMAINCSRFVFIIQGGFYGYLGFQVFFMIIHGSRSVFLDSRLVFMVFHGSWLVYIRAERRRHEVRR